MKNFIGKILAFFILMTLMQGCPPPNGEFECNDGVFAVVPELASITPLKSTYAVGETVIFKLAVLSQSALYNNSSEDIYETTGNGKGVYRHDLTELTLDNEVVFLQGEKTGLATYNVIYNPISKNYELEMSIKFNRAGNYSMQFNGSFYLRTADGCHYATIETDIIGENSENKIEFVVN